MAQPTESAYGTVATKTFLRNAIAAAGIDDTGEQTCSATADYPSARQTAARRQYSTASADT